MERMGLQTADAAAVAAEASWVPPAPLVGNRAAYALRQAENWIELVKFCVVGASGYLVNLAVYTVLLGAAGVHYLLAAACAFVAAATNNYAWNRNWTFRAQNGHVYSQGLRFLAVSAVSLCANLLLLHGLIGVGADKVVAQALTIALVMPLNFFGSKLWAFRRSAPRIVA
jgi:putative flippase GtrA